MVLGLLLRDEEERGLVFDFEALLPDDDDEHMGEGSSGPGIGGSSSSGGGVKKDFKRGTVVCRHWLRALCMKGDNCEFLHQYDMSKMPECRWGMECQVPECPFRHVPDEERVECAFYKQGFCSHGSSCRYRHIKLARDECPETADFSLQSKVADEENVKRRKAQPVNEFYKIAICKHWEKMGSCPFNDECHFAHGDKELRPFPKELKEGKDDGRRGHPGGFGGKPPSGVGGSGNGSGGGMAASFGRDRDRDRPQGGTPQTMLPDENKLAKYFLLQSHSYHNVAHSVHHRQWTASSAIQHHLKMASETSDDVFLIITIGPSKHFQGVVRLMPGALAMYANEEGEDLAAGIVPYEGQGKRSWNAPFGIEWLRICECPWERLLQFEHKTLSVPESPDGLELDADTGHALVRLLFNQAKIQLHYRSVEDEQKLPGGAEELATRRREAAESVSGGRPGFGRPPPATRYQASSPGFVFVTSSSTIDECFGRMLFGLAQDQEQLALQHVSPGVPLFLLNMSDQHLLGVFEAVTSPVVDLVPGAFCHAPNVPSPLPVQVRFVVAQNAPAIPTSDPKIQALVGSPSMGIGALSLEVTQGLIDVFADRSAAQFAPPPRPQAPSSMGMSSGPPPQRAPGPSGAAGQDSYASSSMPSAATVVTSTTSANGLMKKFVVGIENDNEFCVTRRIIGHAGSNMKRISTEASGNAKLRVRGQGSGSKEGGAEELNNEPLMVLVSAENDRSFRIACALTSELLATIHKDYQVYLTQSQSRRQGGGGGYDGGNGGGGRGGYRGDGRGGYSRGH